MFVFVLIDVCARVTTAPNPQVSKRPVFQAGQVVLLLARSALGTLHTKFWGGREGGGKHGLRLAQVACGSFYYVHLSRIRSHSKFLFSWVQLSFFFQRKLWHITKTIFYLLQQIRQVSYGLINITLTTSLAIEIYKYYFAKRVSTSHSLTYLALNTSSKKNSKVLYNFFNSKW